MAVDLTFGLVILVLISWQFSIWWKRHKAITTFVENRKDYQHLLIRPVGVDSPVHEICVAILENLDTKRFRFSREMDNKKYTQVSSILYTPILIYDTAKKVSIAFTKVWGAGYTPDEVEGLSVEGVKLDLSAGERAYTRDVLTYVDQHLKTKKDKLAKLKEQRHRRAITKLYSEVTLNDQTN